MALQAQTFNYTTAVTSRLESTFVKVLVGNAKRGQDTKRKIKHGKERNLLLDESANLGPQQSKSCTTKQPVSQ